MLTEDGKQIRALGPQASVYFRCPKCDKPNNKHLMYAPPIEKWKGEYSAQRERHEWACEYCEENFNVSVLAAPSKWEGTFAEYPEHRIVIREIRPPRPDDADEWNTSFTSSPHEQLVEALKDIEQVLESVPPELWLSHTVFKMAFSQAISVMEAYLSDALAYEVFHSDDVLKRLIETDSVLRGTKVNLTEILVDQDFVRNKIRQHLSDLSFHSLGRVEPLFRGALGVQIFRDEQRKVRLIAAVEIRHDIVHRNGKTKRKEHVFIQVQDIQNLMKDIADLAEDIEFQLSERVRKMA